MKRCTICKESKPETEFHRQASRPDGLGNWCKPCKAVKKREAYLANRDSVLAKMAEYRKANPEKVSQAKKASRLKKYDEYRERERAAYWNNREAALAKQAQYRGANREAKARRDRAYVTERMKTDPMFRLAYAARNRIFYAMRRRSVAKQGKTRDLLGCDWETLRAHLERRFHAGMTWDNYGEWHVDHIVPLASAETAEQLHALCHYTNLQPLWAADNIRKGARLVA